MENLKGKQEKGKGKVGCGDDQTMAVPGKKQSESSASTLPFKKRCPNEANAKQRSQLQVDKIQHEKQMDSKAEDDQSVRNLPGPGSRVLSVEVLRQTYCLSKTLNSSEVIQETPVLYLDPFEASLLTNHQEILDYPQCSFSENLLLFDGGDRRYDMVLSRYSKGGVVGYFISGDWGRFVRVHNLKAGDEMTFYRILDRNVSAEPYYILKYFRKPLGRMVYYPNKRKQIVARQKVYQGSYRVEDKHKASKQIEVKVDKISAKNASVPLDVLKESKSEDDQVSLAKTPVRTEKCVPGPHSRLLTRDNKCLSKTLRSTDVIPENQALHLSAQEASSLTGCPGTSDHHPGSYSKNLLVYDGENRAYDMLLSYSSREYFLDAGWKRFVRLHKLKAGDVITFYRILDKNVYDSFYYILKYFRKPADRMIHVPDSMKQSDNRQIDFQEKTGLEVDKIPTENASVSSEKVEESEVEKNWPGRASKAMTPQGNILIKTLSLHEVNPLNPKLYLTSSEARVLADDPKIAMYLSGSFSKNLVVSDEGDERYNMVLTHHISGGLIGFCITGDWNRFVSTHELAAGDEIAFYRILDESVSDDYDYFIRFLKKSGERKAVEASEEIK